MMCDSCDKCETHCVCRQSKRINSINRAPKRTNHGEVTSKIAAHISIFDETVDNDDTKVCGTSVEEANDEANDTKVSTNPNSGSPMARHQTTPIVSPVDSGRYVTAIGSNPPALKVADNRHYPTHNKGYLRLPTKEGYGYRMVPCFYTPTLGATIISPDVLGKKLGCRGYTSVSNLL